MVRRLQELRHTEQVQRAYALNCGEGATVSYELQLRVLREFGLSDGATELLQNPYKFFPEERFGDESPGPALHQLGRCRVNSSPAMDSMFTDLEGLSGFHPPFPPPPPPYHPPATLSHAQLKGAWRPRVPMPTPTRSFSYPCSHTLLQRHAPSQQSSPDYPSSSRPPPPPPPDCTNQAMGRALLADQQMSVEPVMREFMPDIARGVSVLTLREQHKAERVNGEDSTPTAPHPPLEGQCPSSRHRDIHGPSCKRHAPDPKLEAQGDYPDHYDFSCGPPTPGLPPPYYAGPDLYSHSCNPSSPLPPSYLSDGQPHAQGRPAPDPLRLDLLGLPPPPQEEAQANPPGTLPGGGHTPRGRANETDLTRGLGHFRSSPSGNLEGYEDRPSSHREAPEERLVAGDTSGAGPLQPQGDSVSEEAGRDRRAPSKPEYPYKKSAL
ncbi:BTB/POZ domain-containing protein 7-like [Hypomesus transpacificus]|uniref:BTB/POZ domain-containing protein 7-like n=1 Tax=Hypomesus transpacificus TaxID=137520 RepID=UPI001F0844E0|nr:BTB/POZ domain-containing protein 7-like [Hypomesus transpacificus]